MKIICLVNEYFFQTQEKDDDNHFRATLHTESKA